VRSHGNCGLIIISKLIPLCAPGVIKHELKRIFRRSSPLYIKPSLDIQQLAWLLKFAARCTTGHGMMGISLAPATGKLISELVAGRDPCLDVSPFSLKRFQ